MRREWMLFASMLLANCSYNPNVNVRPPESSFDSVPAERLFAPSSMPGCNSWLTIIRQKGTGDLVSVSVLVDGASVAKMKAGEKTKLCVVAGPHVVSIPYLKASGSFEIPIGVAKTVRVHDTAKFGGLASRFVIDES